MGIVKPTADRDKQRDAWQSSTRMGLVRLFLLRSKYQPTCVLMQRETLRCLAAVQAFREAAKLDPVHQVLS